MTKICNKCLIEKPLELYHKSTGKRLGVKSACKDCINLRDRNKYYENTKEHNIRTRKWKKDNPERLRLAGRRRHYKIKYGLSEQQVHDMKAKQNYQCAICGALELNKVLCIDHDHATGKIREMLCNSCNAGIGHLKDSPSILWSAIQYLEKHK